MSVHIARLDDTAHGFSLLAEQHVPVGEEDVCRAFSRPADMGRWFGLEYEWPTSVDEPMNVGAALEFRTSIGPLSYDFIMIVADRVPGESVMLRTTKGAADVTVEYTWEPTADGFVVRFDADFRLRGGLWWKAPWRKMLARRCVTRGLERMREDMLAHRAATVPARIPAAPAGVPRSGTRDDGARAGCTRTAPRTVSGRRRAHSV